MDAPEHADQAIEIHRFVQAVAHGLVHERVIGQLTIARNVLEAGSGVGEGSGHQVVGLHALQLRRHFLAAAVARHGKRDRRVPPPSRREDRRIEKRLDQDVAHAGRMQIAEDIGERERMLRSQRQQQRIIGCCSLELEVELTAETFAQRQRPRAVDAAAKRRVQHELHAARFVEEALEHERLLGGHHAKRRPARCHVVADLFGGRR